MDVENSMAIPHPDDPFYQPEPEERIETVPLSLATLLELMAWSVEQPDVAWIYLHGYIEAGHPAGEKWDMIDGTVTENGVKITVRRRT